MYIYIKNAFLILSFFICFSCNDSDDSSTMDDDSEQDNNTDDDTNSGNENPNPDKTTTYNADVKSIFDMHCVSCHDDPPTNGAPFAMRTYAETIIGVNRDLVNRMQSINNPMPPEGNLSQDIIDIILDWEADGFLEE
ncbi:c-type cytochrome [Aquimarina pacifica]|uniref:c-type cytochrome n=1 Tax=Aquimarina pacifica TaxID=1296415 RepID=UPI00046FFE98|nr:cytochrome c [Aquimarina pacifica]